MIARIDVAGGGTFGTAMAIALGLAGHRVTLWMREGAAEAEALRENPRRLAGCPFPDTVTATADAGALTAEILLLAVPTQQLEDALQGLRPRARFLVSCAKGIELRTLQGPTARIAAACPDAVVAQLTGPSFAREIAAGLPTALTLACADDHAGEHLQAALSTPSLRLYRSTDVIGAELGGALKNVIAIACGACIGAGLGDSARAALMTRGFAEMIRLAGHLGAEAETLSGLSGLGDLALTCLSETSRNFSHGLALARGEATAADRTVEGVATARAVARIAREATLDLPVTQAVARLVDAEIDVTEALRGLLSRPLKPE